MTDRTPQAGSANDDAVEWLLRHEAGHDLASDSDFQAWLEASPENAAAWSKLGGVWQSFDAEPDILLEAMRAVALEAAAHPLPATEQDIAPRRPFAGWAVAAATLACVGGAALYETWPVAMTEVAESRYESPSDRTRDVRLADGSQIRLEPNSALTARFPAGRREVRLVHGEAYFRIVHDSARPFTVSAADDTITDVGTEFDLLARVDGSRVLVVKGAVAVNTGGANILLKRDEGYDSSPATRGLFRRQDTAFSVSATSGYLEFHRDSVAAAIGRMNQHAGRKILLLDARTAALPITGRFKDGDSESFAEALAEIYALRLVHRADGTIELRPKR